LIDHSYVKVPKLGYLVRNLQVLYTVTMDELSTYPLFLLSTKGDGLWPSTWEALIKHDQGQKVHRHASPGAISVMRWGLWNRIWCNAWGRTNRRVLEIKLRKVLRKRHRVLQIVGNVVFILPRRMDVVDAVGFVEETARPSARQIILRNLPPKTVVENGLLESYDYDLRIRPGDVPTTTSLEQSA
jgi:hypothetical protein